jgi:glycerate 2-kinase
VTAEIPVRPKGRASSDDPGSALQVRVDEIAAASPGLLSGPCESLRRSALEVAVAGLAAADPGAATRRVVTYMSDSDTVRVADSSYPLTSASRVWVLGAGKATYRVASALEETLGDRLAGGVIAVRDPGVEPLNHVRVICADHPLPSPRSVEAATEIMEIARAARSEDLVLACFTGGSSALASLPPAGVSAADKRKLHELLLSSGLAITDVNAVRKSVSDVKGGRVAVAAAPATVVNLTVSDVAGSPLDAITDPTVQDSATSEYARTVVTSRDLWERLPESVRVHLGKGVDAPVVEHEPQTVMLADGASTVAAMAEAARALGFRAVCVDHEIEGEADEVGRALAERLLSEFDQSPEHPLMLLGCGGESVVTVTEPSSFSKGGPNQHAALRAASVLRRRRAAALFIDTDGSDGGTELAGGLVDGATVDLAVARGVNLEERLAQRQSSKTCDEIGAGVRTGHTGTNVNDLFVLVAEAGGLP